MSLNLENIILDFFSSNDYKRKNADSKITNFFNSMKINDLSNCFSILKTSSNNNVKLYISIIIKNFIEQKINLENRDLFIQYLNQYKYEILNIILYSSLENKTINLLLLSFCKGLSFFQIDIENYNKIIYELSFYILQYYINKRNEGNKDGNSLSKSLFICSKFIKYIDKEISQIKYENIYNIDKFENDKLNEYNIKENDNSRLEILNANFYNIIVEDYSKLFQSIFNKNNLINEEILNKNNIYIFDYFILYLKIFKYSLIYLEINNREKILDINYNLMLSLFNQIINNNNNFNFSFLVKYYSDIISLSNKIIIKYLETHITRITLNTIKNYIEFFYSFISNENLLNSISNFFDKNETTKNYKPIKFILNIIQFLYKLFDLVYVSFPEYKMISRKSNDNNNLKEINDYIKKEFLTKEKIKIILTFIIQKCLIFNDYEINMAQENLENFYLSFTEFSSLNDIKTKSGELCNLIFTIFRRKYMDIFQEFENTLISLTIKENELLKINQTLSGNELNIKCALLLFFNYLDDYFNLDKKENEEKFNKFFLEQINIEFIKKKGNEIFSSFIIIRLLTKVLSNNFIIKNFKIKVIEIIQNIFFSDQINEVLIELACFDLFNEYIDMQPLISNKNIDIFPHYFIQNYLIKICKMINKISSPEIHSKIIETTNNIINISDKEKIILDFSLIIPSLELVWENKYLSNKTELNEKNNGSSFLQQKNIDIKNKNKIYIVRRDLIRLINIIIKKIGFYTYYDEKLDNNFIIFHNFIYQIINYAFNSSTNEEKDYLYGEIYKLIILIQDNYCQSISLSSYKDINNIINSITQFEEGKNYILFSKFFDFFNTILLQASKWNNNQFFLPQLFIIEQFLSFCFFKKINNFIEKENFIDKIIYILNNMINNSLNDYSQFIFNIMEYILYIINTVSNFSIENKNKYTDFIFQFILKIINQIELNKINFDIYFGSIQLANRLIYVNACKNIISEEFNNQIIKAIITLYRFYQNQKDEIKINFIQKNILQNCLYNLQKLFKVNNNNKYNIDIFNIIKEIYNNIRINNKHPTNYDINSLHWLFFFNKISNDLYFFKLTSEEDKLRLECTQKFEKKQIFFSINKEFEIKYFFLKIDSMISEEIK